MSLTFLWTDIMVWILVVALVIWGRVVLDSPQVQKKWETIFKSSVVMVVLMGVIMGKMRLYRVSII